MKKRIIISIIFIVLILIIISSIILKMKSSTVFTSESNKTKSYDTDYYKIDIPTSWTIDTTDDYTTMFYSDDNIIGSIEIMTDCSYCETTSSIIENKYGMHGYAKDDPIETDIDDNYKMIKVLIGYKKSAAMEEDSSLDFPDQLHYFYTNSKNLLIDLYLDSSQLSDEEMDKIANSLVVKN